MELHLHNVLLCPHICRPEQVAHIWLDSHQRWIPQFVQETQRNTPGMTATEAGTPGASLGASGDHTLKPYTTPAAAPAPSDKPLSLGDHGTPGGAHSVVPEDITDAAKDIDMENDAGGGDTPDPPSV